MDVNGTRFHLMQGADDWARCTPVTAETIALGQGASLRPLLFQFPSPGEALTPDLAAARRGAARDRYGNWYWIDADGARLRVRSAGSNTLAALWPVTSPPPPPRGDFSDVAPLPAPPPCRLGGLTITEDHYLLVGTLDQPGLLIFDLHQSGPPRHVRWPDTVPFAPFDLAASPGGGAFVLDRVNRCYWALDRQLGVIDPLAGAPADPEPFGPASGLPEEERPPPLAFPRGLSLAAASPLAASDPVAIEALPDGSVLILDRLPVPRVLRYCLAEQAGAAALELGGVLDPSPPGPPPLGADLAFIAGAPDRIYVPAASGQQAFAFVLDWREGALTVSADLTAPYLPMRQFGGKGLVATGGVAYYDFQDLAWVPLVEQRRPRFERDGTFDTPPFDGREPGCVWHRLFIDGCLPPTASIAVWSRVADDAAELPRAQWMVEPAPRPRPAGRELPFSTASAPSDTLELLFQRARGRWLQLRIRLRGDGRSSPKLSALRIWYPRFSYLSQYLPAVYRDDPESASFLERFLANLEGLFTSVEDKMALAQLMIDARTAPAEALDWLASWFGVALDPAWTEAKRRLLLRHAMDFFRLRGTTRGLRTALRLVLDDCADEQLFADQAEGPASIRILEWYRLRTVPPAALGDPSALSGIRRLATPAPWTPAQGGAALATLYRAALRTAGEGGAPPTFPVFEPVDGAAPTWRRFVRQVLSLSTTAAPSDAPAWRAFLAARYASPAALNAAWGAAFASLLEVSLPTALPPDGVPLADWYQFQLGGGRFIATGTRWVPAQGRARLSLRWHQYLQASGVADPGELPAAEPAEAAALWRAFCEEALGFVPAAGARDQAAWRDFLSRRYRRIGAYKAAWGEPAASFQALALPRELPADGAPLCDWYDFQRLVVATRQVAHRFTVLLPVAARDAFAVDQHLTQRELARRIVNLEKPAHTLFDVKFYWAMFRVGEARLAVDTLLDQSSRVPLLMPPAVLGTAFLAESHLSGVPPERERERAILGSRPLRDRPTPEEKRS